MSFDNFCYHSGVDVGLVSIPLEQGSVFRHIDPKDITTTDEVSIPLEQGSVFRRIKVREYFPHYKSLNPFGTGQCLSTAVVF